MSARDRKDPAGELVREAERVAADVDSLVSSLEQLNRVATMEARSVCARQPRELDAHLRKLFVQALELRSALRDLPAELLGGMPADRREAYEQSRPEARCKRGEHIPSSWNSSRCMHCDATLPSGEGAANV